MEECHRLALKQSEQIALRQELITETEGRFTQALSGILPRVAFSSSDKRQDGTGSSAFTLKEVPERKFVMSQPLFSGFKEFAAMAATQAQKQARIQEKARAQQLLFIDVADAFTLLTQQQQELEALAATRTALMERIEELKARERLGRSRPSEVASAETQRYRLEAEIEQVRSQEVTARQLLEFLTGLERIPPLKETDAPLPIPDPIEVCLMKGAARPDLKAAEEASAQAQQEVRVAKADFWPTVGLEGNYFVERVGASKEVDWDAALKVEIPLYQGGQAAGAVKEASSKARQAKLRFSEIRRRAAQEIRETYTRYQSSLARVAALEKAHQAAEENHRLQAEEYSRNLVSNLEVLQALEALQEERRDLIQAEQESRRLYWRLQVAVGEVPNP